MASNILILWLFSLGLLYALSRTQYYFSGSMVRWKFYKEHSYLWQAFLMVKIFGTIGFGIHLLAKFYMWLFSNQII